jgi:hypothetical protein
LLREDENDGEPPTIQPGEDAFETVLVKILSVLCILEPYALQDAFTTSTGSIFATRLVADLYLQEEDYQNAIWLAESGLDQRLITPKS